MDKAKIDAITEALLEPGRNVQKEYELKRAIKAKQVARQSKVAWFMLSGSAILTVAAYVTGQRLIQGFVWGGIVGALLGWLYTRRSAA